MVGLEGSRRGKGRLSAALLLIFIVALGSSQMVRPARAFSITGSSFAGTTFINEHFQMEIGPRYATLYDPYVGSVLVQRLYWSVQMIGPAQRPGTVNSTLASLLSPPPWIAMNWTTRPAVQTEQLGSFHRVVVSGVMDNQLAVSILFDGNSTGISSAGPKISVVLQSIEGGGVFRVQWRFEGVSASAFNLENRTGPNKQLIYGPMTSSLYASHLPSGENSIVALGSDGRTILFGANWQDALSYYQGVYASPSSAGADVTMQYGQFPLGTGQAVVIDPFVEGGDPTPTVYISNPSISEGGTTAPLTWATLTWSDSPSDACDNFQWGTSTSYGNTINTCSHTVTLNGLQSYVRYYYKITACASNYNCGTRASSFYAARQLLQNWLFETGDPNQVLPWLGFVWRTDYNWKCENDYTLTSICTTQWLINPANQYQVKGALDGNYMDPAVIWYNTVSQGCGWPDVYPTDSTNFWDWSVNKNTRTCTGGIPTWSPPSQLLLDKNQYFTTIISRTDLVSRTQTLAAWWVGWAIANFAVDFYARLESPVYFYAPDSCGNWAVRESNFVEFESYTYMHSMATNQPLWGEFPVNSTPVVVALSTNPPTPNIWGGCTTSGNYWIYVRTHPVQIDACKDGSGNPAWCPLIKYNMYNDIVSAERSMRFSLSYSCTSNPNCTQTITEDGKMMAFQIGIEAANYQMIYWVKDTEWWGSG